MCIRDRDQIEYMSQFVNIWCSKIYGYTENTPENLAEIAKDNPNGIRAIHTPEWDQKYGTFAERMSKFKAEGDKVWWYACWRPSYPYYANILHSDPGIMHRIMFWQQKQCNVDGFLYFYANGWNTMNGNPWVSTVVNPGLNPVSYTHPDVYKRQRLSLQSQDTCSCCMHQAFPACQLPMTLSLIHI